MQIVFGNNKESAHATHCTGVISFSLELQVGKSYALLGKKIVPPKIL